MRTNYQSPEELPLLPGFLQRSDKTDGAQHTPNNGAGDQHEFFPEVETLLFVFADSRLLSLFQLLFIHKSLWLIYSFFGIISHVQTSYVHIAQSPKELQLFRGFLLPEEELLLCLSSPYQPRKLPPSRSRPTLEFIPRINYLAGIKKFEESRSAECPSATVVCKIQ